MRRSPPIAVQIDGDHNTVTITAGTSRLTQDLRHQLRDTPRVEHDLLRTDLPTSTLVGRAGAGKTRLAIQLVRTRQSRWLSLRLRPPERNSRFQRDRNLSGWHWPKPTLVVVDAALRAPAKAPKKARAPAAAKKKEPADMLLE